MKSWLAAVLVAAIAVLVAIVLPRWWRGVNCDYNFSDFAVIDSQAAVADGETSDRFAGWYRVESEPCGSACQNSKIIRQRDDTIIVSGLLSESGLDYRPDSRLLIARAGEMRGDEYYFLNERTGLEPLCRKTALTKNNCANSGPLAARHPLTGEIRELSDGCAVPLGWTVFPRL